MTKVAVVGCGYWGKNLVRNFAELGALGAVVDPNRDLAEGFASRYQVRALELDAALNDAEINGVVIAAPAEMHADLALRAFENGKHVFVEKPIALTLEDGERMKAAAVAADRKLMVGHLLQYHAAFVAARRLVRSGDLGKVRYAYSNRLSFGKFRVEENAFWSLAPHDVSMILALMDGDVTRVRGEGSAHVTEGIEDEYRVDLSFSDGSRAHIFASWLHPFKEQRLVVVCERGMVVFEDSQPDPANKLMLYPHALDLSGRVPEPKKADAVAIPFDHAAEPLKSECRHFLDCVQNNEEPLTNADEALRVLRVLVDASRK